MSTKHFFPDTTGVVVKGLQSLVARNSHLELDEANKVVFSRTHPTSKISVISGGGSGHEPAWSGYVGDGMLAAAVCGEVFASPSTKQIMAAIQHVPSDVGIILCGLLVRTLMFNSITNYTGDNLHFGLAREKARGMGHKVAMLRMTDDVALGREQTENLGRRGLAGNMFGEAGLVGAASHRNWAFERCTELGESVNAQLVTVGSSLDHCHVPGRAHHDSVPQDAYVLGMGIHNEPGLHEISPIPSAEDLISQMLAYLLDPNDKDRAFVPFKSSDETALLINNFGGMSNFELEALTGTTDMLLKRDYGIAPVRIYAQAFETSLNAPGWSISLFSLSGVAKDVNSSTSEIIEMLDMDTTAPAWPRTGYAQAENVKRSTAEKQGDGTATASAKHYGPSVDATILERALRKACTSAVDAEPDITKWDIQMGDGDCGEAVVGICHGIVSKLDSGLCKDGSLFHILDVVGECVEEIGGTLGAIISIVLASFTAELRQAYAENQNSLDIDVKTVSAAAYSALQNLMSYTSARVGGRTVMDALIPFCETLKEKLDMAKAVDAAEKGAKATAGMKAKFGRATYVGDKTDSRDTPPDPGAWAAAVFLRGFLSGLDGAV
ncbi:hypothetical protein LTR50_004845 [Elasticomyces elasticus]|nr:hypothetical protein LTR50_004845 [Elasticomyces elasticus]